MTTRVIPAHGADGHGLEDYSVTVGTDPDGGPLCIKVEGWGCAAPPGMVGAGVYLSKEAARQLYAALGSML